MTLDELLEKKQQLEMNILRAVQKEIEVFEWGTELKVTDVTFKKMITTTFMDKGRIDKIADCEVDVYYKGMKIVD